MTYHIKYNVKYNTTVSSASVKTEAFPNGFSGTVSVEYTHKTTGGSVTETIDGWKNLGKLDAPKEFTVTVSFTVSEKWSLEDAKKANPTVTIINEITQTQAITSGTAGA